MRLEFDIDSEVYPELHAALSALKSPRARAERLRQLAAAGLVWEKVRLHGTSAFAPSPTEPHPDVVTRPDVVPPAAATEPLPALARRAAAKRARTPDKRRDAPAVDLAINAEPMPVPPTRPERRSARPTRQEVEQAIRELPVLMDVVADVRPMREPDDDELHEAPAHWSAMNAYPEELPGADATPQGDDGDALGVPEAALHLSALAHKPATRSRLMRMKERGLFKNG
ncbi:MAG TPA: hypothetical protein VGD46_18875 [Rhizobacter sp.]